MQPKKLFLLDGFALIYRAYFAFSKNPRITSYGFNTSAIFGYTNTLLDLLKKEKPSHIGVAFDTAAPTQRHVDFEDYKIHRQEQPEDITKAIPYIMEITKAMHIPILINDGYEADDIIGTIAKKAEKEGFTVYMVTPDKDFGQLVSPNIFMYKPARMGNDIEILGVSEILKKWEISRVDQVIDILGLWGDAVDNIPGVPGIGEKTSKLLIQKYDTMENLLANTSDLKGKQKENLESFKEQALLSKRLATIDINVPVDFNEKSLLLEEPDRELCDKIFTELEFRALSKRLFQNETTSDSVPSQQSGPFDLFNQGANTVNESIIEQEASIAHPDTIENTSHTYHLVNGEEKIEQLISALKNQKEYCFDTETTSLDTVTASIVGLSFCFKEGEAYFVPLSENWNEATALLSKFKDIFESKEILKIGQNIKFDMSVLKNYGINVCEPMFDTMLAHYIIEPDLKHGMDYLSRVYLNYQPVEIETLIGKKGKNQLSMRDVELDKIKEYAAEDADVTFKLKHKLEPELINKEGKKLFEEVEIPLIEVLSKIELEGIRIDDAFLNSYSLELGEEINSLEQKIFQEAGVKFNIASPKQLGEVLFDHLKLDPKAKKTKTGQYQTGEDILQGLVQHDIAKYLLETRQLQKLKSTYVDALPLMINYKTGRVHTSFNQAVAATGRLSSNNPNLQNIPIKTDKGREVRKAFLPRNEDYFLLSADYSQIELRIIASIAEEENMIEAFKAGLDIHTATAAKVYGISLEEVNSDQRRNAKAVNFGIIYGQSAFGLSQNLGIPRKEAAQIIDEYFKQYPRIRSYMDETIAFAQKNEFVQTLLGRRRYVKDINSKNFTVRGFAERNAINAPIQGSAADLIKVAMIKIHKKISSSGEFKKSKLILQVHDELLFDAHKDEVDNLKSMVVYEMENAMKINVPIRAEVGIGNNWLEAH